MANYLKEILLRLEKLNLIQWKSGNQEVILRCLLRIRIKLLQTK
jgi:hypothetical protein